MMSASSAFVEMTQGIPWIIIGWVIVIGIALLTLLELGNVKETPIVIGFVVFLGWAGPFSILYFLPLDLSSSKYRQCLSDALIPEDCVPPLIYISASDFRIIWQSIYWTLFCLTWFAIPILQCYCDSGGFTPAQSLRKSLRYNAWYYGTIGIISLVALAYYAVVNGSPNFLALKSIGMALSNAYGLILLLLCLSYGLVDVPRELWLKADAHRSLAVLEIRATRYRDDLQTATRDLDTLYREIAGLDQLVHVSDPNRPFVDKLLLHCPEEQRRTTSNRSSVGFDITSWVFNGLRRDTSTSATQSGPVTLKSLQQLHRQLKKTKLRHNQCQFKWQHLVDSALFLQDILENEGNSDKRFHVMGRFVAPWWQRLEYVWYIYLRANTLRLISIIFCFMSLIILWSEVTVNMGLSVLALVTRTHSYTVLQIVCLTAVGFMTICTFVPLLSLRVFSIHKLAPNHHSSIPSLLFFAAQMTRFTFPMCWNFSNLAETNNLVFSQIMGTVNLVPLLGEGFNDWLPISLVILCSMTLLNVQGRFFKLLHLDTSYVAAEDDNETGLSDRADGRLLLQQARLQRVEQVTNINAVPLTDDRRGLLSTPETISPRPTNAAQPLLSDDAFVPLAKRGARQAGRNQTIRDNLVTARASHITGATPNPPTIVSTSKLNHPINRIESTPSLPTHTLGQNVPSPLSPVPPCPNKDMQEKRKPKGGLFDDI